MLTSSELVVAEANGREITMAEILSVIKQQGNFRVFEQALTAIVITEAAGSSGVTVSDGELQQEFLLESFRKKTAQLYISQTCICNIPKQRTIR